MTGFLKSLLCFFASSECFKWEAFVVVGDSEVGIKAGSLLVGNQGFFVPLEFIEGVAFLQPILFGLAKTNGEEGFESDADGTVILFISQIDELS